eukprot:scaffold331784_cov35-Prasinocladus_malaysianus.AAC.2
MTRLPMASRVCTAHMRHNAAGTEKSPQTDDGVLSVRSALQQTSEHGSVMLQVLHPDSQSVTAIKRKKGQHVVVA